MREVQLSAVLMVDLVLVMPSRCALPVLGADGPGRVASLVQGDNSGEFVSCYWCDLMVVIRRLRVILFPAYGLDSCSRLGVFMSTQPHE